MGDVFGAIGDIFGSVVDAVGDVVGGIADFVGEALGGFSLNPLTIVSIGLGLAGLPTPLSLVFDGLSATAAGGGLAGFFTDIGLSGLGEVVAGGAGLLTDAFSAIGGISGEGIIANTGGIGDIGIGSVAEVATDPNNWGAPSMIDSLGNAVTSETASGGTGLLSTISGWIEDHPTTANLLGNAIGGGLTNLYEEQRDEDEQAHQLENLRLASDLRADLLQKEKDLGIEEYDDLRRRRTVYGVAGDGSGERIPTEGLLQQANQQIINARQGTAGQPRYRSFLPDEPNSNYQRMLEQQKNRR